MHSNRRGSQRGITLISFVFVLIVIAFFVYMAMVLGPGYNEYYGVVKAMNFVAAENTPGSTDKDAIIKSLDRQFTVGYVDTVEGHQVELIRAGTGNIIKMKYEVRKPFVYNIDFVQKFEYSVPLGSKTAGD
jgi:hypothetical protein